MIRGFSKGIDLCIFIFFIGFVAVSTQQEKGNMFWDQALRGRMCGCKNTHMTLSNTYFAGVGLAFSCLNEQDINPDSDRILIITLKTFVQSVRIQPGLPPTPVYPNINPDHVFLK